MKELFAKRLKRARIMAGFSMDMLADSIGVSKEAINKYEKGKAQPDSTKLISICNALGVKIDYFFRPETFEMDVIEFRKKAKLGARKVNQLKESIKDKLERYLELEDLMAISTKFKNPLGHYLIKDNDVVERAARHLRDNWKLGKNPIGNVVEMLEDNGVKVIEADEVDAFDGLSSWINSYIPLVVVNANFTIERKRFTLMHELGHLLLNFPDDISKKEKEAFCNRFAGAVLFPGSWIKKELGFSRKHFYIEELSALQKDWGLSILAILYRAKDMDIINSFALTKFYMYYNSDDKFKKQINKERFVGSETSGRFNQLLFKALAQEIISTGKAAALSNQNVSEIKSKLPVI